MNKLITILIYLVALIGALLLVFTAAFVAAVAEGAPAPRAGCASHNPPLDTK